MKAKQATVPLAAALLLGSVTVACSVITGSGEIVTVDRSLDGFSRIDVSDGLAVELQIEAGANHSVQVRYDDNLVDQIITRVSDGTLVVEYDGNVNFSGSGRAVLVVMPSLDGLSASGGSAITASGDAASYSIDASGGSAINTSALQANDVTVDVSGGAAVQLLAAASVTGEASGGAAVSVLGSPAVFDIQSSGGASVDKVGD